MHDLSLQLVTSSFNVIILSIEVSRKISKKNNDVEKEPSTLDYYASRSTFQGFNNNILQCNLLNFVATYSVVKNEIRKRPKEVITITFPNVYSDPKTVNYPLFCKYQLIKYKPWSDEINNARDNQ